MSDTAKKLESEVLKLPKKYRARIAERLLSSLDPVVDPDWETMWIEESERRLDELMTGKVDGVASELVFKKARAKLG